MTGLQAQGRLKAYGVKLTGTHEHVAVAVNSAPATLAVLDSDGGIVCQGEVVAAVAALVSVNGYRQFLRAKGWERIGSEIKEPAALFAVARISTVSHEGLRVELLDPSGGVSSCPGALAILDGTGRVIVSGQDVADEVEAVMVRGYRDYLKAGGWLRTLSAPPAQPAQDTEG
ncbi:hypothetical protein [Ideonella benzenivorans]|uniref:hypothetical protein n=1 Tax=Ideonella benzenivorans TaxID=2831643 RepID=UPI001CEC04E2|nr:hypothetical protein [Ideonella benzenivorans]